MEKELARFLMNYLLENEFPNKKDLAAGLDVSKRNVQRILNGTSSVKEGNSALGQILLYFVNHRISLFKAWNLFTAQYGESVVGCAATENERWMPMPEHLSEDGVEVFNTFILCLNEMAGHLCRHCTKECAPDADGYRLPNAPCSLGDIAAIVGKEIRRMYHAEPL